MEEHEPIVDEFIKRYCSSCIHYENCGSDGESDMGLDTVKGRDMLKLCILTKILENLEK